MPSGLEDKHVMHWIRSQHSSWEQESNCIRTEGVFFSSAPFFRELLVWVVIWSKEFRKRKRRGGEEKMWGPLKGWLIPPDREILILNLKVLIFTSLKSTAFDDTNTRVIESIAFLCKVTWTRTSSIIIHWTFCATLSVAILMFLLILELVNNSKIKYIFIF